VTDKPKVCYLRGSYLNPFESQYLEPLQDRFDLTLSYSRSHRFEVDSIPLPKVPLGSLDYLNGLIPRRLGHRQLPNVLKTLGYDEVLLGLDEFLPGFDLIHSQEQSFYFSYQVAERKKKYGYKLISVQCMLDPYWYQDKPALAKRAQVVREATDVFIARSYRAKAALVGEGVDPEKVRVVGHGVDLERFHPGEVDPSFRASLGIEPGRFVILFVGRLTWPKGVYPLVDAANLLLKEPAVRRLDPLFLIVGDGPERIAMQRRIRMFGIESSFKFIGRVPYARIPEVHRLGDIFILPSISERYVVEQFGIVLIEAMATARPVISTLSGAIDEVVGEAGMLIPSNDSYQLYQAMLRLVAEPPLRQELGGRGLERVRKYFTHEIVTEEIASAYWQALDGRKPVREYMGLRPRDLPQLEEESRTLHG
jgi:glycosyltransferase involved in cell wall biosynthesis